MECKWRLIKQIGLIIDHDASISNSYKVTWPRWSTVMYTPVGSCLKINFFDKLPPYTI